MATQNGNSNGSHRSNGELKDTLVWGQTSQGTEIHANPVRLTRYSAVFELYSPVVVLRVSEVISDFKIVMQGRTIYSGRAVVRSLVNAGTGVVCEVALGETGWRDAGLTIIGVSGATNNKLNYIDVTQIG